MRLSADALRLRHRWVEPRTALTRRNDVSNFAHRLGKVLGMICGNDQFDATTGVRAAVPLRAMRTFLVPEEQPLVLVRLTIG